MTILEKIEEIVKRYNCSVDNCIKPMRYDNDENEYWIEKEIREAFSNFNEDDFKIKVEHIYSSCSYEVDILIVAYRDENNVLQLFTQKLELF